MNFLWRHRHWGPAVVSTVLLVGTVPYLRPLCEALRAHGLLRLALNLLAGVLMVGFFWCWIHIYRSVTWPRVLFLAVILALYGWAWVSWIVAPEERFHFASMALLTGLFYHALRGEQQGLNVRTLGAGLLAAVVGMVEEGIQIWIPSRQFDASDIGKCVFSAVLAAVILRFILDSDKNKQLSW